MASENDSALYQQGAPDTVRRPQRPFTLADAEEVVWQRRPNPDASTAERIAFHRRSAEVYARAAKTDQRHQHEAMQWAAMEIRKAREIEERHSRPAEET
ncbi:AMED_5909 family protein [Actinophytocola sp. NPDC049390]|uniref:AMED_5909 family protein n=1 Tax=Actinophytocola sp. NPDC049390 TaxID=3363894 RepID=UPI0037A72C85